MLYLDSFDGASARLRIDYLSQGSFSSSPTVLFTQFITLEAGGSIFGAADPSHQRIVNPARVGLIGLGSVRIVPEIFSSFSGRFVEDSVGAVSNAPVEVTRSFLSVDNWPVVFSARNVRFSRTNNIAVGATSCDLFSASPRIVPRYRVDYLDMGGAVVASDRPATGGANTLVRFPGFGEGGPYVIWSVRIAVGTASGATGIVNAKFIKLDFAGNVSPGTFDVTPGSVTASVHERVDLAFSWTVPSPLNWHDLETLKLRIKDGTTTIMSIAFDEATRTFAVREDDSDDPGKFYPEGSQHLAQTRGAVLHLKGTEVVASGPTSPTVTLRLPVSFKPRVAGALLSVEVAATDDAGIEGDYEAAATIDVRGRH